MIDYTNPALLFNVFFLYSFLGWIMECIVIRREKGKWENRGFVHAPFCIIYGFGALVGYLVLKPFAFNWLLLYLACAVIATVFEYLTALLMLKLFGNLWWDYTKKPYNYKGILCLESSIGWGFIGLLLFAGLHNLLFSAAALIPAKIAPIVAFSLVMWYFIDFCISMRKALRESRKDHENLEERTI